MATAILAKETAFFEENRERLLTEYGERYLLIHGAELIGDFVSQEDAVADGYARFGAGPFLVRRPGEDIPVFQVPALALGLVSSCQR